jgi:hypothetical protein
MKRLWRLLVIAGFCALVRQAPTAVANGDGGLTADFNDDNVVDDRDLIQWNAAYGVRNTADADGNSHSDGTDFLMWQRQLGSASNPDTGISHNPEPASVVVWSVLAAVTGLGLAARRGRRGR